MTTEENAMGGNSCVTIEKVTLENFKSYRGKQEIGPFKRGFSVIVGSNGIGKSNIIDSLLFVFGFRATKIRQQRVSDLIHFSDIDNNINSCSVELLFNVLVHDSQVDQINLRRVAYRSNKSEYFINNNLCSYGEVSSLLQKLNIDTENNRFLLLQGEVESISLMKPKANNDHDVGLLEYLETVMGTHTYKTDLIEMEGHCEDLNIDINAKNNKIQLLETDLALKKKEKDNFESHLNQENILSSKKRQFFLLKRKQIEKEKGTVEARIAGLNESILQLNNDISEKIKELRKVQDSHEELKHKGSCANKRVDAERKCLVELEKKKASVTENIRFKKSLVDNSLKSSKSLSNKRLDINNLCNDLVKKEKILAELNIKLETECSNFNRLKSKLISGNKGSISNTGQGNTKDKNIDDLREVSSKLQTLKNQAFEYSLRIEEVETLNKTKRELEAINVEITNLELEINDIETKNLGVEKELLSLEGSIEKINDSKSCVENNIKTLKYRIDSDKNDQKSQINKSKVYSKIRNEKISGVHGCLSELFTIGEEYYNGLLVAMSSHLDSIVVDSAVVGQKCIDFIKKYGYGRATFIVLDKMRPFHKNSKSFPGKRLIDLIKPVSDKYLPTFYYTLKDTLIADTLDEATNLAFNSGTRYRVVTKDGKLIEKSGIMTNNPAPGRNFQNPNMSKAKKNTVQDLEDDLQREVTKLDEIKTVMTDCRARVEELKSESSYMKKVMADKMLFMSKKHLLHKNKQAQYEKKSAEVGLNIDINYYNNLKATIQKIEQEKDEITNRIDSSVQKNVKSQEDNKSIEFNVQRSKVNSLKEQISLVEDQMAGLSADIDCKQKDLELCEKEIQLNKIQGEEVQNDLISLEKDIEALDSNGKNIKLTLESLEKEIERINVEKNSFLKREQTIQNYIKKLDIEKDENENEKSIALDKESKLIQEESSISRNISNIKFHEIEGVAPETEDIQTHNISLDKIQKEIKEMSESLREKKLPMFSIEEYKELKRKYDECVVSFKELEKTKSCLMDKYQKTKKLRLDKFMEGLSSISSHLKNIYKTITNGGNASLELVDTLDPFSEGIILSVMPPKKSWKNIIDLSGGEKTLSSLSLIFALHQYKPTPIYFMDEIDAALDFKNVERVARYIKQKSSNNTQFILISLRKNMFERADCLIGIYKYKNTVKSVALPQDIKV